MQSFSVNKSKEVSIAISKCRKDNLRMYSNYNRYLP